MTDNHQMLELLCKKYDGKKYLQRCFIQHSGFFFTVYYEDLRYILSIELPGATITQLQALKELVSAQDGYEYFSPTFRITLSTENEDAREEDAASILSSYIESLSDALVCSNYPSKICTYCQQSNAQTTLSINGYYCACHNNCYPKLLKLSRPTYNASTKDSVLGLFFGFLFAVIGAGAMIPLAIYGIMPGLGGLAIGLFASLGFRMFNRGICTRHKIAFALFFLIISALGNFAGDFFYAQHQGQALDFINTYSNPVNMFNAGFDILSATLIAYFSINLIFDANRNITNFSLKKLSKDGKA